MLLLPGPAKRAMLTVLVALGPAACQGGASRDSGGAENSSELSREEESHRLHDRELDFAVDQYRYLVKQVGLDSRRLPAAGAPTHGRIELVMPYDWVSGFFPGTLWYLYEYARAPDLARDADVFTDKLASMQDNRGTHDLGFMMMSSYGNGLRLGGNTAYATVLQHSARALASRYSERVGCIRSWDFGSWSFPVIIDNMVNLELLYWAGRNGGGKNLTRIASRHADTTMAHHFRANASSFHLVDYDRRTGAVRKRQTVQGYADDSAWARGQGWALYGYTVAYRFTHQTRFLEQAQRVAAFILTHPRLPADKVPYWDFDDPKIPDAPRDSSAASVYAAALYELADYVDPATRARYRRAADTMLESLSSPAYRARRIGDLDGFLLGHGVGMLPRHEDVDVPLAYGDYYYVEALVRRWRVHGGRTAVDQPLAQTPHA